MPNDKETHLERILKGKVARAVLMVEEDRNAGEGNQEVLLTLQRDWSKFDHAVFALPGTAIQVADFRTLAEEGLISASELEDSEYIPSLQIFNLAGQVAIQRAFATEFGGEFAMTIAKNFLLSGISSAWDPENEMWWISLGYGKLLEEIPAKTNTSHARAIWMSMNRLLEGKSQLPILPGQVELLEPAKNYIAEVNAGNGG